MRGKKEIFGKPNWEKAEFESKEQAMRAIERGMAGEDIKPPKKKRGRPKKK